MIQPTSDRILVERLPVERSSGIIVPNELSTLVKIIAVGPGKWHEGDMDEAGWLEPTVVKPGQKAIIGEYTDLDVGQQVLCQEGDIRCIVD